MPSSQIERKLAAIMFTDIALKEFYHTNYIELIIEEWKKVK